MDGWKLISSFSEKYKTKDISLIYMFVQTFIPVQKQWLHFISIALSFHDPCRSPCLHGDFKKTGLEMCLISGVKECLHTPEMCLKSRSKCIIEICAVLVVILRRLLNNPEREYY